MSPGTAAILLCAGRGERLGADVPKALVPLAGRPLFAWSLEAFDACADVDAIILVGPRRSLQELAAAAAAPMRKVVAAVEGGQERQHSVARGLQALPEGCDWVAVHDSARVCVTTDLISRCIASAREHGAAIAAAPLADTVKRVTLDVIVETVPRAGLWSAQTPQVFRRDWLERAHAEASGAATDDAALVEALGHPVRVVPSLTPNLKVTTVADLELAERWLRAGTLTAEDR